MPNIPSLYDDQDSDDPSMMDLPDYGFGPVTQRTRAGLPNLFMSSREPDPTWGERALAVAEFPARAYAGQFHTAASALADTYDDPSLANLTNAGVQSGMALLSPTLTAVSGLGGLGLAALRDADLIPSAEARSRRRSVAPQRAAPGLAPLPAAAAPEPADPVLERIKDDPSLIALYQQIKVEQNNATRDYPGRNGDASRAEAAARVQGLQGQFADALAKRDAAKQGLYDRSVLNAEAARDLELSRDRRFSDTEVGKVYDKLGGWAPLVAGMIPGAISRLAYGPAETVGAHGLRALTGAGFGIGANNVPLVYNSFSTEVDNPEQRAYAAYAYNLPDGHPDKAKAQAMADKLPTANPIRKRAQEELYDPVQFGERAFMGALEGAGGNELGQMLPGGIGGLFRRASYQLPPGGPIKPSGGPRPPSPTDGLSMLDEGTDEVLRRTSNPVGPSPGRPPFSPQGGDKIPPTDLPKNPPVGGRRSKSAGSKGPSKSEKSASSEAPAASDKTEAASDELKRFFGAKQAPDLRDRKATGGAVDGKGAAGRGEKLHAGPLHSDHGGRTDTLPVSVRAGSFVVPADVVSHLGENNTSAGMKVLDSMFPKERELLQYASGGAVPIMAAGGEYVVPPETVARIGGGDLTHGQNILDQFVLRTRNDAIKTLQSLPGPQK